MNSLSELRLLTTGPVGLAAPSRLAGKAAAPESAAPTAAAAVQTAEKPNPAPEAGSKPESRGSEIHRRFARFDTMDYADGIPDRDFEFGDLLDIINPLQHIPIVGSLYRKFTGDEISGPAKILGGLLYGGPIGLVAALVTTIAEQEVGRDLGEAALAALFGDGEAGDLQLAEHAADAPDAPARAPAQLPAQLAALPAAYSAAFPAVTPAAGAGPRAVLSGQDALDAFVRDLKGARPAPPIGGTGEIVAIEVVPLPPLPPLQARQPAKTQLVENAKIGAIAPGPLGWTIQRRADLAAVVPAPPSGVAPADPLAAATEISDQAFSERMLQALDKYRAMSVPPPHDEDQAPRVDIRL